MIPRRSAVGVVCCVLALVVLAGCLGITSPDGETTDATEPDPEALFEGVFVHSDDLEDVSGEVRSEATDGNATAYETLAVAERPYVEYRDEVLEASASDREGQVYVSNATTSWWYYPDLEAAQYYETDDPYDDEAVRSDRADQAAEQVELYDLEYAGTEEVADREAHVLEVEAKDEVVEKGISVLVGDTEFVYALETIDPEDELDVVEQTVWIDAEYEYPLKEKLVIEDEDGDRYEMVERFETVSFNEDLADDYFEFEPGDDVVVQELG